MFHSRLAAPRLFFIHAITEVRDTRNQSVLTLVDYFALRRLSGSLLGVVLNRHAVSDFHDFASDRFCNDISAFHWELARYASTLRFRNAGNEA